MKWLRCLASNQRSSVRDGGISSDYLFSTLSAPELFVSCINGC